MSHLEALITATLQFLGVSYTEAGIHFMAPFVGLVVILVVFMAALVTFLQIRQEVQRRSPRYFEKSVLADIRSL